MPKKPRQTADNIEQVHRQIEEAVRVDLFTGVQRMRHSFARGSDADAFAQALRKGDAKGIVQLIPFKSFRPFADRAADKIGTLSPQTRAQVRRGIKGGFVGPGLTNDLVTKPLNFDAPLPGKTPSQANARDAVHDASRRIVHQTEEVKAATRGRFATYMQDLTTPSRQSIQASIEMVRANKSSLGQARDQIRNVIGLTDRQAQAVRKTYTSALLLGQSEEQAGQLMLDHSIRLLDYRAETIAVTETRTLGETIKQSEWLGLEGAGVLGENPTVTWILGALDDKTCPLCIAVSNTQQPLGMNFTLDNGTECLPGFAHPRCRCYSMLTTDDDGENAAGKEDVDEKDKPDDSGEDYDAMAGRA